MTNKLILRPAEPADVTALFKLIQALAEYEKLFHAVTGNPEALKDHLFSSRLHVEAILTEYAGQAVGFALFFHNYSTFLAKPGIYLEDLFILPEYRRQGIGKALLTNLAQLAVTRGCGRLEWSVLDWNEPAIAFYRRMGALIQEDRRICRITGDALAGLATKPSSWMPRSVVSADISALFSLLQKKAEFDQQLHALTGKPNVLWEHLFGSRRYLEAILVERDGQAVGFATFFYNYSTFLTKPGIYIDDLFVLPEYRQQGIGKAILAYLGQLAIERNCGRLESSVATWNEQGIAFYQHMGADILPDWRICRVTGESLTKLALNHH